VNELKQKLGVSDLVAAEAATYLEKEELAMIKGRVGLPNRVK